MMFYMKGFILTVFFLTCSGHKNEINVLQKENVKLNLVHSTSFVVFPQDCNANMPMLFGGKLLAEMDRCAAITTRRFLYNSTETQDAVTIAINNIVFHKSAEIKDLIFITGTVTDAGTKSVKIKVIAEKETISGREVLVEGEFVFCSYNVKNKKAVAHGVVFSKN